MLSVAEAFACVLATARPLPAEIVPLPEATGRVLAESLNADRDFPPFDRVTMDGIALAHAPWAAGQTTFAIEHVQYAGAASQPLRNSLAAIEVMTGAVLPPGTDTVVRYEDLELANGQATITIPPTASPGLSIHRRGSDRRQGELLLPAGTRLGPAEIAVAATIGAADVAVIRAARLAVVSTGDELVAITATPQPYQIRRSNAYALRAMLVEARAEVQLFHLPDTLPELRQGLVQLLAGAFDAIVLSGAVSKGRADHLPRSLQELGVREIFHEVAQRPGKPMWFGQQAGGGTVVFGLPGNPVSTLLTAYRYLRPWLRACQGLPVAPTPVACLTAEVRFPPPLTYFLPVHLTIDSQGIRQANPLPTNTSGDLAGLLGATAFLELPAETTDFPPGSVWPAWSF